MQSNEPGQRPPPEACPSPPEPEAGGSGQGAASAYARMQSLLEQQTGRPAHEPEPNPAPP